MLAGGHDAVSGAEEYTSAVEAIGVLDRVDVAVDIGVPALSSAVRAHRLRTQRFVRRITWFDHLWSFTLSQIMHSLPQSEWPTTYEHCLYIMEPTLDSASAVAGPSQRVQRSWRWSAMRQTSTHLCFLARLCARLSTRPNGAATILR